MGSFVFKWDHPAEEVFVTGTFDDWSKSEKLMKKGDSFEKDVTLAKADEKIYYKFVVDGKWITDHTAPQENDASGNLNNVLTPDRIVKHTPATAGIMSGVVPTSTSAELAKDVPLEKKAPLEHNGSSELPGAFPETPAALEQSEQQDFSVNPLPAADGAVNPIKLAPGEKVPHPSEFTTNSITSGVHDDPELVAADKAKSESEPTFGISPLPAFAGGVNPIKVAPGEGLPKSDTLTANTIDSGVRTDKESYENSGGLGTAPILPDVVTPQAERDENGTGVLDLPPITKSLIPESSLPMGEEGAGTYDATPTIQSAGPQSTTAMLAADVPLESSKVPGVVKESQEQAGFAPEASAIPAEVSEKSAVEKELKHEVPVAPTTSEGVAGEGTTKKEGGVTATEAAAAVGGAALALGGAAVAAASSIPSQLPESVTSKLPASLQAGTAQPSISEPSVSEAAKDTPAVVKESIAESGQSPEAAVNEEAVLDKKAVEKELLSEIKPETSTGEPAPAIAESAPNASVAAVAKEEPSVSRDVSPHTIPTPPAATEASIADVAGKPTETQTAPTVTTGVAGSETAEKSLPVPETPAKDAPVTPAKSTTTTTTSPPSSSKAGESTTGSAVGDKKKKRTSIFGKLKAKFHKE